MNDDAVRALGACEDYDPARRCVAKKCTFQNNYSIT